MSTNSPPEYKRNSCFWKEIWVFFCFFVGTWSWSFHRYEAGFYKPTVLKVLQDYSICNNARLISTQFLLRYQAHIPILNILFTQPKFILFCVDQLILLLILFGNGILLVMQIFYLFWSKILISITWWGSFLWMSTVFSK